MRVTGLVRQGLRSSWPAARSPNRRGPSPDRRGRAPGAAAPKAQGRTACPTRAARAFSSAPGRTGARPAIRCRQDPPACQGRDPHAGRRWRCCPAARGRGAASRSRSQVPDGGAAWGRQLGSGDRGSPGGKGVGGSRFGQVGAFCPAPIHGGWGPDACGRALEARSRGGAWTSGRRAADGRPTAPPASVPTAARARQRPTAGAPRRRPDDAATIPRSAPARADRPGASAGPARPVGGRRDALTASPDRRAGRRPR